MRNVSLACGLALASLLVASGCVDSASDDLPASSGEAVPATDDPAGGSGATPTAATCEIHIGLTTQGGNVIFGYGGQAGCGTSGRSLLTIQRWSGWRWDDLTTATVIGSGHDVFLHYICSGTGTHEYRTIHTAQTIGDGPRFKESNHIVATCT